MVYNYKVVVQYDGSNYNGFQKQKEHSSIQEELEIVISRLNSNTKTHISGSGRTDAKVHADCQVCTFKAIKLLNEQHFLFSVNRLLPDDINVLEVELVDEKFHARYSSIGKEYHYYINLGQYDVFKARYIYQYNKQLSIDKMIEASKLFIGTKDFRTFSSARDDQDTTKILREITINQEGSILKVTFIGKGFLRYMVRKLMMILIEVGEHKVSLADIETLLTLRDTAAYSHVAPPQGLYLHKVYY